MQVKKYTLKMNIYTKFCIFFLFTNFISCTIIVIKLKRDAVFKKVFGKEDVHMIKAGIIGATGYAGAEIVRILMNHKEVEIAWFGSRSYIDQNYADIYSNFFQIVDAKCMDDNMEELAASVDVIFTSTPQGFLAGVLTEEILNKYKQINEEFSDRALRVLAFSIKDVPDENFVPAIEDEVDLTFVGLMAMIDPPRKEVFGAVKEAISAGIKTIMITGDHKTTAAAIAKELGIMSKGDKALTGQELDALSEKELSEQLEHITVYARVSPENKIRIVKAWQEKGKVTAMTGDGVNDAPALKQANIGIGMGSGTDVAKDAAAMVLTDDNFATIVNAIEIGRTVYSNIKKSITYLLAGNLAAIIAIVFAVVMNWENPFTTLQLLFINLINDSLPAIALAFEAAEPDTMNKPPRDINEGILQGGTSAVILIRGIIISIAVIFSQYLGNKVSPVLGASMAFSTITLSRIFQTLPARSDNVSIFKIGVVKNKHVLGAIFICLVLYFIVLLPGLREIFSIPNYFGLREFAICILLALISTALMELIKVFKNRI